MFCAIRKMDGEVERNRRFLRDMGDEELATLDCQALDQAGAKPRPLVDLVRRISAGLTPSAMLGILFLPR